MKRSSSLHFFFWLASLPFLIHSLDCQEPPRTMTKISTRALEPRPKTGSFSAQAKTLWRAGTKYARIAEAPDPPNRIHALVVVNEPDAWVINLFDKSGRHIVDPGPTFNTHVPIFEAAPGAKTKMAEVEFGRELEFFTQNNARHSPGEAVNGRPTERYEVTIGDNRFVLWTDTHSKKPVRVSCIQGNQTQTFEYLAYEELKFDPSLFQPPAGIAIQDSK